MKRHYQVGLVFSVLLVLSVFMAGCAVGQPIDNNPPPQNLDNTNTDTAVQLVGRPITEADTQPQQSVTATPIGEDVLADARAIDLVFINIYERVNPSVVNIEVVDEGAFSDSISSSGSGFVYDTAGHIITNAHVVIDARAIFVTFSDGYVVEAEVVGADSFSDLAVIRVDVDPSRLNPIPIGDSSLVRVGQSVVVIGNPFGLKSSMTIGSVSATGRALPSEQLISRSSSSGGVFNNPSIIQVDAVINPGNSGGPVLNLDGEVIGVAAAIRTETGIFQGVAFAVPANTLKRIAPQLIATGEVAYPYLGISSPPSDLGISVASLAEEYDLPVTAGVLISDVRPNSPASDAGLLGGTEEAIFRGQPIILGGDIIIAVNAIPVRDLDELLAYLVENTFPGDTITLTVVRGDSIIEVELVVGQRP